MNQEQASRLLTLAYFHRTQITPKEFDLLSFTEYEGDEDPATILENHNCGTTACSLGYCPVVFPEDWRYDGCYPYIPCLISSALPVRDAACGYFGLDNYEVTTLFFATKNRSPLAQAKKMEELAASYGWTYED